MKRNSFKVDLQAMAVTEPVEDIQADEDELDLDLGDLDAQIEEMQAKPDDAKETANAGKEAQDPPSEGQDTAKVHAPAKVNTPEDQEQHPDAGNDQNDAAVVAAAELNVEAKDDVDPQSDRPTDATAARSTSPEPEKAPAEQKPASKPALLVKRKGLSVAKAAPKVDSTTPPPEDQTAIKPVTAATGGGPKATSAPAPASITPASDTQVAPAPAKASKLAKSKASAPAAGGAAKPAAPAVKKSKAAATAEAKVDGADTKGEKRPRAQSAYFIFMAEKRPDLKKAEPGLSMGETSKRLGEMWKALSAEDKAPYEAKAAADKEAVKAQQDAWDASHPKEKPAKKQKTDGGEKKQKAAKAAVAVQAPAAKPKSAFASFSAARRVELRAEMPEVSLVELSGLIEQEWRNMSEEEKAAFEPGGWALEQLAATAAAAAAADGCASDDDALGDAAEAVGMELDSQNSPVKKAPKKKLKVPKDSAAPGTTARPGSRRGKKRGRGSADDEDVCEDGCAEDDQTAAEQEEAVDDEITSEPDFIICMDNRTKYWVKMKDAVNMYDFKFVDANQVKQLRNKDDLVAGSTEDGFNGYGAKLLSLADDYDRFKRQFDTDARECLDSRGGLNFDLMLPGSHMDMCAMLATLRDKDLGGVLANKPNKRQGAVKGLDDMIIHLPAMMLSMVVQRMVGYWMARAERAEQQLQLATKI